MNQVAVTPKSLGQILTRARKKKKLSQDIVSKKTTIGQKTISFAEQGSPGTKIETIFSILSALDLEMVIQPKEGIDKENTDEEQW